MSENITIHGRDLLKRELEARCRQNPHYSLRAFAKSLGISHTILSLVLSGKRELSKKAAAKVGPQLGLSPAQHSALLTSSSLSFRRGRRDAIPAAKRDEEFEQLSLDAFAVISEWHYYAILSLLDLPSSKGEPKWIARRLGISEMQAKLALEKLIRLELIQQSKRGRWKQSGKPIKIDNAHSTGATRVFYKGLLAKASEAIDEFTPEERDLSSMTLAIDSSLLPYARERIKAFRRELTLELEARGAPNSVFEFMIQFFPLSKKEIQ